MFLPFGHAMREQQNLKKPPDQLRQIRLAVRGNGAMVTPDLREAKSNQ